MRKTKIEIHKVKVEGPIVNFFREIDLDTALKIASIAHTQGETRLTSDMSAPQNVSKIPLATREYLIKFQPKTNAERILVFAKYLQDKNGKENFTAGEIKEQFELAHEPIPTNLTRDFNTALSFGWIAESTRERGSFYITETGYIAVESNFSETTQKKNSAWRGKKKGKFAPTVIRKEIQELKIETEDRNFPGYFSLKTKSERILWLLAVASNQGIETLNQKEIAFLADRIGDNIPKKSITSLISPYRKNELVSTPKQGETRYIKILQKGKDFLTNMKGGVAERPKASG